MTPTPAPAAISFDFDSLSLARLQAKPGVKWHRNPDVVAAWVADMDFAPPPAVVAAMRRVLDAGDLGYPDWKHYTGGSPASGVFVDRCAARYGWRIAEGDTRELNDVVQGIQMVLHLCTQPGDRVVVHTPSYPPFLHSVEDNGRRLVRVPAARSAASPSGWAFDHEALDRQLQADPAKVLLLCHPHNPTGHVFSTAELQSLAALAERHELLIISDEIHADLTYAPHVHQPMALYAPERTVTIHAASKAFNVAALRYAIMHVGPAWVDERLRSVPDHLFGATNLMGAAAAEAAWRDGDQWLAAALAHLDGQRTLLAALLAEQLPAVGYVPPLATYLAWLDCRALGLGDDPAVAFARRGVQLSEGPNFGVEGHGFARLNFATSSGVLREAVRRMADAS
ncbi:MAG: aminotransferase class I/II-fold pyridoxal phosphate-dependent enzyme [Actinomycetota bacterium]|nr:aminotransferase class I/II-fold pyridoxal phosphate-dependent enzyme [Actinomycetota bacterium]